MIRRSVPAGYAIDQSWLFQFQRPPYLLDGIEHQRAAVAEPRELSAGIEAWHR